MNTVNFTITNKLQGDAVLFQYQYDDCYNCLTENVTVGAYSNLTLVLSIMWYLRWTISLRENNQICSCKSKLNPGVDYNYVVQLRQLMNDSRYNCTLTMDSSGIFDYLLPLYVLITLLCFCGVLYYTFLMLYRHRIFQRIGSRIFLYKVDLIEDFGRPGSLSNMVTDEYDNTFQFTTKLSTERRLRGLDTFRGISILLMVFVNYGGGGYWFFDHSIWNGLTIADLVFPWFVFVMGITLSISIFRSNRRTRPRFHWIRIWLKGCKRSIILFLIGVALESKSCNGNLNLLRIMGPLQRLAGGYFCLITFICIISYLQFKYKKKYPIIEEHEEMFTSSEINSGEGETMFYKCRNIFKDIWICLPYIFISVLFLFSHACISLLVKVPNCRLGYMGPGGIGDFGCCVNCSGGVSGYIDRVILTPEHMYQTPTSKMLYQVKQAYDPEGILGYLNCTALCFLGYWAGNVILLNTYWSGAMKRLVAYAIICALIGLGLCEGKTNGGLIPINKNLWSVSFVMVSAGTGFFVLAFMFTTVDVLKLWNGSPFKYPGMNPIVIYCGHIIFARTFPISWTVSKEFTYKLLMDIWGTIFWTGIGYIMYTKKIFITV